MQDFDISGKQIQTTEIIYNAIGNWGSTIIPVNNGSRETEMCFQKATFEYQAVKGGR